MLLMAVSLIWTALAVLPAQAATDTSTLLYPLPVDRTPDDGDTSNDGDWMLVDFATAGSTGNRPATAPDWHYNDDDSAVSALPFTFNLYEDPFTDVFINNNGNLSFGSLFSTFTSTGFPVSDFPMVAPFWGDVDTGSSATHIGNVWWKEFGSNTFVVTWDEVGYFDMQGDLRNTFQVAISDGTNADMGLGNNVCFSYGDMQWTTGSASGGSGGFGGTPATVGVNRGNGVDFAQVGLFDHAGSDYNGPDGAPSGVDFLDGKNFCLNASGLNVPPIPQGIPPSGMVMVDAGTPFALDVQFLSPEFGQTTTVTIDDVDGAQAAGLNIVNTPGNLATVGLTWTPANADAGIYQLDFTAVDDFDPPGETVVTLYIEVIPSITTGTINIVKTVDDQPDGAFDDDPSGWEFSVTGGDGLAGEATTDATGLLSYEVPTGDYDVAEAPGPAGMWVVGASCVDEAGAPVGIGVSGVLVGAGQSVTGVTVETDAVITCSFANQHMAGYVTGGGMILDDDEGAIKKQKNFEKIGFGGNVGAAYDGTLYGQVQVNLHNVSVDDFDKGNFHSSSIDTVLFEELDGLEPASPPDALYNYVVYSATGRFNGEDGWRIWVEAADHGEPASGANAGLDEDTYRMKLFDTGGTMVYDSAWDFSTDAGERTVLDNGNVQIHPIE